MKGSAAKIQMTSLDDLFGGATPQAASDQIQEISLTELHSFKDHPFHVVDDEKMQEMAESVEQYGVLVPGIVRPRPESGYELVAGHRRKRASELAGRETMPVIVRELDDDEATIIMVDSNLQREKILPSEKAFAYKLKLEAMKRKAGRPKKDNCVPLAHNLAGKKSRDILAEQVGESQDQIRRYIRLTYLLPALLQMVDDNKLAFRPAVEVSALTKEEQELLLSTMNRLAVIPTLEQAQRLKAHSQNGQLNSSVMEDVLAEKKPGAEQITLKKKCLSQYFPKNYTQQQMEEVIFSLLETWKSQQKGALPNDSDG
ncbi:ParB/RepB/Spo0J family partition protein [Oscillospiraceae bacterium 21-37]